MVVGGEIKGREGLTMTVITKGAARSVVRKQSHALLEKKKEETEERTYR